MAADFCPAAMDLRDGNRKINKGTNYNVWLALDLGCKLEILSVKIMWQDLASEYEVQTSDDGMNYVTIFSVTEPTDGIVI